MSRVFKAHKGKHVRAEFEAHTSAVRKRVFAAHATRALKAKRAKSRKIKVVKVVKPKKMNMAAYKTALTGQVKAALEARQGL